MFATSQTSSPLLKTADVARLINASPTTIRRWAQLGYVPHVVLPSGGLRFDPQDLDELLAAGRRERVVGR
jgi:predicted site-specific integrase-resolvase